MNALDEKFSFLASSKQIVSWTGEEDKVIVFERGDLVFVFNFHPVNTYDGYKVGCDLPGKYRVALDSDASDFGGHGRVGHDIDHFTSPEGIPGVPETNFNNRPNSFKILSPARTCVVYYKVDESKEKEKDDLVGSANEDVFARHVEEDSEGLAGCKEENDIAVGEISKTEDDDIDTSKPEDDDVDSNKIEDLPVRGE